MIINNKEVKFKKAVPLPFKTSVFLFIIKLLVLFPKRQFITRKTSNVTTVK